MKYTYFCAFYLLIWFSACGDGGQISDYLEDGKAGPAETALLQESVSALTDVIVHDIFSPPVASRIYAYASVAAYECARYENGGASLAGMLNELEKLPQPDTSACLFWLASIEAFYEVGSALIFSEQMLAERKRQVDSTIALLGIPTSLERNSREWGVAVGQHILAWSRQDNYSETRSYPKYTVLENPDRWKPTPPAYMDGIEPAWREIRPFVIDSAAQFRPPFPTPVDFEKGSNFWEETMEVFTTVNEADEEEVAIASFWDCNPYALHITGHVMAATKKITPGGHWMEITSIANKAAAADFESSARAYALVAISLADAFISCWDEKYRSNLVRPETVINELIDADWKPLLQTPPFPEYTSGHSVISSAAAVCLTMIYGDSFSFKDDSEEKYGLPARSFGSFYEASEEAAISRLYGGIHYRPAIENGVTQGKALGKFVMKRLNTVLGN